MQQRPPIPVDSAPGATESQNGQSGNTQDREADAATLTGRSGLDLAQNHSSAVPSIPGLEVQEVLGAGGMGVVYLARQVSLNRAVALKVLRGGRLAAPEDRLRFRFEAEAVARLQHPNIVQVFQVGEEQGSPWLLLEYVAGGTLAGRISREPLPQRRAAELLETLARAVHAAHLRGIVHLDLKPANVLLSVDGAPKISDFGLARPLTDNADLPPDQWAGTPAYMSPEQAWGATLLRDVGPTADVYGLGAILYHLLAGRAPFVGGDSRQVMRRVWSEPPAAPRDVRPEVSADLEAICLKCLRKSAGERYPSAEALADDLRRFLDGYPALARPAGGLRKARMYVRRHPARAALLAVAVTVGVLLAAGGVLHHVRVNAALAEAKANLGQAQQAVDEILTQLGTQRLTVLPDSEPVQRDVLLATLGFCQRLAAEHPRDPDVRHLAARARRQVADVQQVLGETDAAEASYSEARRLSAELHGEYPARPEFARELAVALNNQANLRQQLDRPDEALAGYRAAVQLWDALAAAVPTRESTRDAAVGRTNLGLALAEAGQIEDARKTFTQAIDALRKLPVTGESPGAVRDDLAAVLSNRAALAHDTGNLAAAAADLEEAHRLLGAAGETGTAPDRAERQAAVLHNLAAVLAGQGRWEAAERRWTEAYGVLAELLAAHPQRATAQRQRAEVRLGRAAALRRLERVGEAEAEVRSALADNPSLAPGARVRLHHELALTLDAAGKADESRAALDEADRLGREAAVARRDQPDLQAARADVLLTAGTWLWERDRLEPAAEVLRQATELQGAALSARPHRAAFRAALAAQYRALADVLLAQGEALAAEEAAGALAALGVEYAPDAAGLLVRCLPLALGIKAVHDVPESPEELHERWAAGAVRLLADAVAAGRIETATLRESQAYASLRGRSDFERLLAD
jgi:tetratricopeptide (TPR) repeat protein